MIKQYYKLTIICFLLLSSIWSNKVYSQITVDLTSLNSAVTNAPGSGATITWHSSTPISNSNKISDPTSVTAGAPYYMAYYDAVSDCYSPDVKVPTLFNLCPDTTINLTVLDTEPTNVPSGTNVDVTWHTASPATNANKIANPSAVAPGIYYMAYYDTVSDCYSPASPVITTDSYDCTITGEVACLEDKDDYSVYVHSPAGANNTNAASYKIISSEPTFFVTVDQTNQNNSAFTALDDFNIAQEWVPLGHNLGFDVNGNITVRLEEDASPTSSGMWINADAIMFVDQFGNRNIIDNSDATQSGTWNSGASNAAAYNNRYHYIQTGTAGTNIFTWTLNESEVIQSDDDQDGIPNGCDLDDDNDGILDIVECTTNDLTNGEFTGSLSGWTATGNWFNRGGVDAYVNSNTATSSDLSQSITMNAHEGIFTYDLLAFDGHPRNAFLEIYIGGVHINTFSAAEIVAGAAAQGTSYYRVQSAIVGTCGGTTEIIFRAIVEGGTGAADDVGVDNVFVGTCDTDGDCLANHLEVDSDNDGCGDALEAAGSTYTLLDLDGGLAVDTDQHPIDANGVPANSTNVGIGSSTDDQIQPLACDECNPSNILYVDTDGDGIGNACDADDDNDGIEDCDERFTGGVVFTNPLGTDEHFFPNSYNTYTGSIVNPQNVRNGTMDSDPNGSGNFGLAVLNGTGGGYTFVGNHPISQLQILPYTLNVSGIFSVNDIITFDADVPITIENPIGDLKVYIEGVRNTAPIITTRAPITIIPRVNFGISPAPDYKITMYEVREFSIYLASSAGTYPNGATFKMEADCLLLDTDGDGIPDNIDTDADGDGCPDALESTGSPYTWADLNPDGSINTTLHPVGPDGFNGGNNYGEGSSKDPNTISDECDTCNENSTLFTDNDNDTIGDDCDLDDDNDGILDADECEPLLASITTGNDSQSLAGTYENTSGTSMDFDLVTDYNTSIHSANVTSGLMVKWDQDANVLADITLTLEEPVLGALESITIASGAPGNTYGAANASKEITMTWPGGGTAILNDPLGEITSHSNGAVITSGTTITLDSGSQVFDSEWTLEIDLSSVTTFPIDIVYESDASINTGGIQFESFAFIAKVTCDFDNDGIPNYLDLDSDNDGCPDALEGDGGITLNDIDGSGMITGNVNEDGVPEAANNGAGQGDVSSTDEDTLGAECTPIAVDDVVTGATTGSPVTVDVTGNDSDPDGSIDPTTVDLDPSNTPGGTCTATDAAGDCIEVTVPGEGVWTVDETTGEITFTPETGFTDDPSPIEYTVDDNDGNTSNTAEISVDYDAQDPIAVDDVVTGATTGSPVTVDVTGNDSDPDGSIDPTTVDLDPSNTPGGTCTATDAAGDCIEVTVPGEGVWTVDETTGEVTFTPETGFTDDPSPIEYTVDDNDGNTSNTAEISVDYDAQDPIAVDDVVTGATTGSPVTVDVTGNDSDPDGSIDPTTVDLDPSNTPGGTCTATDAAGDCIEVTVPGEGVWTVDETTGEITFTPETGFTDDPSPIEYTVDDNDGNTSNTAEISVDYDAQDPIAVDDVVTGATTGLPVTVDVTGNDSDPDGSIDPTTVDLDPSNTPGGTCTATDAAGDCIEVTVPGEGVWTVDETTGEITFTPETGFTDDPSPIEYTVDDNDGNTSNTAEISVDYDAQDPIAVDDVVTGATTGSPVTVDVTGNDSDPDGSIDPTTVDLDPSNTPGGTCTATDAAGDCIEVTVPGEGVWTVDETTGEITFTPETGFTDDPSPIEYTVDDNDGNTSNTAEISVDYDAQDPIAVDDVVTGATTGLPVTVDVTGNDSDPDGSIDPTTVDLDPSNTPGGTCTATDAAGDCIEVTVPGEGVWTVDETTGEVTFTPETGFTDDPSPIEYTVDDNDGNTSNTAEISVDYDAQDPIAVDDVVTGATTGLPVTVDVTGNDSDPDGSIDPTTVDLDPSNTPGGTCTATDAAGDCIEVTVPGEGVWTVDETTGEITFTPETGFTDDPSPIEYTVDDNDGNTSNTAEISVDYDAQDPIAVDDVVTGATTGSPVTVDVTGNDSDPDGSIDPTTVDLDPSNTPGGTCTATDAAGDCIEVTVPGEGVWTVDETTGEITFTPETGFTDDPSPIEYTVDDNDGNTSNTAEISVDYDAQDPIAVDDVVTGATTGSPVTVDVTGNDSDPDGSIDPTTVDLDPSNTPGGTCTATDAAGDCIEVTVPGEGVWTVDETTGEITFTPETGFTDDPSPIEYTVDDNDGNTSNTAEISVDYDAQDPIAVDDVVTGATTGSPVTVDVTGNDSDPDGSIDPTTVDLDPSNTPGGTCTATDAAGDCIEVTVPGEGVWTVDETTGEVTFTPETGFTDDPSPIEYTVDDNDGNTSNTAEISVDYDAQDPIAVDDVVTGATTGSPVTVDVTDNDSDPDGSIDPTTVDLDPSNTPGGTCTATDAAGDCIEVTVPGEGVWTVDETTGEVTFTPETGFTDDPSPIEYTVDDNDGNTSNTAEIGVDYDAQDPIAVDDVVTGGITASPVTVDVTDNDSDPDGTIDPTTVDLDPSNSPTGSTCTATDAAGDCIEVTVPGEGVWTVDETTGEVTFTPETGFTDDPSPIEYTVDDNDGNTSNTAEISVDYDAQDPIAVDDVVTGATTGSPVTVDVTGNDSDPDGSIDPTTVDLDPSNTPGGTCTATDAAGDCIEVTVPGEGVWTVDETTGEVTFTPETGFTDDPSPIEYTVDDNDGNTSNTAEIGVDYDAQDPIAVDDVVTGGTTGSPVTVDVTDNDSDPDGSIDPTTVDLDPSNTPGGTCTATDAAGDCIEVTVPGEGVWTVDETTGEVTFTPETGFTDDPSPIEYTVDDNDGNTSNTAEIGVDYDAQDPIAVDDVVTGGITASPVTVDVTDNDSDPDGTIDPTTVDLDPSNSPTGSTCTATDAAGDCIEVTVPGEGVWTVDETTGEVTFTPETGFTDDPSPIEYTVDDNDGNTSNTAEISVDYDDSCNGTATSICDAIADGATGLGTLDCDGDGEDNATECENDTDPTDPCSNSYSEDDGGLEVCAAIADGATGLGEEDCDNGGIDNATECENGTDPNDPTDDCDLVLDGSVDVCEILTNNPTNPLGVQDCDGDGEDNATECDNGTDPDDPCSNSYSEDDGGLEVCAAIADGATGLGEEDCDNGGIDNATECENGTDPNDPTDDCDLVLDGSVDVCEILTNNPTNPLGVQDCDGDGEDNATECDNGTDPDDPCSNSYSEDDGGLEVCAAIADGATGLGEEDCDNGGIDNATECENGTDPNDPTDDCDLVLDGSVDVCEILTNNPTNPLGVQDCDGDGEDNATECDNGTDPDDPCSNSYSEDDGGLEVCAAIADGATGLGEEDCDNGGIDNATECENGTDPNDPTDDCDLVLDGSVDVCEILTNNPTNPLGVQDCDGDGEDNATECDNGTDPDDPCSNSYSEDDGGLEVCAAIADGATGLGEEDCDNGGIDNATECENGTDPNDPTDDCDLVLDGSVDVCEILTNNPTNPLGVQDCDGDGEDNATECDNGTDPDDPCSNSYSEDDGGLEVCAAIADGATGLGEEDCDNGGIDNATECENGTDPNDPTDDCDLVLDGSVDVCEILTNNPTNPLGVQDCDGDGEDNATECDNGTDPDDPCSNSYSEDDGGLEVCAAIADGATGLGEEDCDNGGIDNATECENGTDPNDPTDDCDLVLDGSVDVCEILTNNPTNPLGVQDCDGDGEDNATECDNGTDPDDPCSNSYSEDDGGLEVCAAIADGATGLGEEDCDNGGIDNATECENGTDPNDPTDDCDLVLDGSVDVCEILTNNPTNPLGVQDCDGDGEDNATECDNGTDPDDPCSNSYSEDDGGLEVCAAIADGATGLGEEDCDNGGIDNATECENGTDPNDPTDDCDLVLDGSVDVCEILTNNPTNPLGVQDCDGDGEDNATECDNGTDPDDPCSNSYSEDDGGLEVCAAIADGATGLGEEDCDNGGIDNATECENGTDPNDPTDDCDLVLDGSVDVCEILTNNPTNPLGAQDCDGDGVTNAEECDNGTDPDDPCSNSYSEDDGGLEVCAAIADGATGLGEEDCDNGGIDNATECENGTDPNDPTDDCDLVLDGSVDVCEILTNNPTNPLGTQDCDGDGDTNQEECDNGTDPTDPCSNSYIEEETAGESICDAITANPTGDLATADCDGDGVINATECTDGTDPSDSCDYNPDNVTVVITSGADCDGDGLTDQEEVDPNNDGDSSDQSSDPFDPCDPGTLSGNLSNPIWADADCDGDGVTNGDEVDPDGDGTPGPGGTNPTDPCDYVIEDITLPVTAGVDCDGDGVIDGDEITDGTDPTDPCDLNIDSITVSPSSAWNDLDCDFDNVSNGDEIGYGDTDGDGLPNFNDPDDDNDGVDTINEDYTDTDISDGEVDPTGDGDPQNDDTDGDGTPDYLDDDDDGDGILTSDEYPDEDGDGIGFGDDAYDSDGDGLPNYLEVDNGVLTASDDDIEIFNAVTPNGDNDNDVFTIENIELFPENQVRIYNRWGVLVYDALGYGQNGKYFSGRSSGRVTISEDELLPIGTYYYIVTYVKNGATKEKAGYLYIQR